MGIKLYLGVLYGRRWEDRTGRNLIDRILDPVSILYSREKEKRNEKESGEESDKR